MFVTDILAWVCIGLAIFGGGTVLRRLTIGRNSTEMGPVSGGPGASPLMVDEQSASATA